MKFGILSSTPGWHFHDLVRAAHGEHQLTHLDFRQLHGITGTERESVFACLRDLSDFDAILVRAMPAGSLEQVVARMDLLFRLEQQRSVVVLNSAKTIEAAVDKYLCSCRLRDAGLPVPSSALFQSPEPAVEFVKSLGGVAVTKPVFGSEGRGVRRIETPEQALSDFQVAAAEGRTIYVQQFVASPKNEFRFLVIGEQVYAVSRYHPGDWRKNVSLGGTTRPYSPSESEKELAVLAAHAVGSRFAGIDVILNREGQPFVLEVNSSPGWKDLSQTLGKDIGSEVLNFLASEVNQG